MQGNGFPFKLSAVVPIRNEGAILRAAAGEFASAFDAIVGPGAWNFVLVINGSTDNSLQIAQDLVEEWPGSLVRERAQADFGNAMREGLLVANGEWSLVFNIDHLCDEPFLAWAWSNRDRYDLVLGSKRADPTLNRQDGFRQFLSNGLNALLHFFVDHTCADTHGMKLIRSAKLRSHVERCVMRRGQFDTELTYRALLAGLWVAEAPMAYAEKRRPRNLMLRKILQNVYDMIRLRRTVRSLPWEGPLRYRRVCREDLLAATQEGAGRVRAPAASAGG